MSYAFQIPKTGNPEVLTEAPLQIPVPKAGEVVIPESAAAVPRRLCCANQAGRVRSVTPRD